MNAIGTITIIRTERYYLRTLLNLKQSLGPIPAGLYRLHHDGRYWQERIHTGEFHNVVDEAKHFLLDEALTAAHARATKDRTYASCHREQHAIEWTDVFTINR